MQPPFVYFGPNSTTMSGRPAQQSGRHPSRRLDGVDLISGNTPRRQDGASGDSACRALALASGPRRPLPGAGAIVPFADGNPQRDELMESHDELMESLLNLEEEAGRLSVVVETTEHVEAIVAWRETTTCGRTARSQRVARSGGRRSGVTLVVHVLECMGQDMYRCGRVLNINGWCVAGQERAAACASATSGTHGCRWIRLTRCVR